MAEPARIAAVPPQDRTVSGGNINVALSASKSPQVYTEHRDYEGLKITWARCRDTAKGSDAVKRAGILYLPALDSHKDRPHKYAEYVQRALFYNAVGRTVQGLAGAVFQKEPVVKAPPAVEDHLSDITLNGQPLEMFAHQALREYLLLGRYGVLVDLSDKEENLPRPYWVGYSAEDIVNWRYTKIGGDAVLTLVVLHEIDEEVDEKDEFVTKCVKKYRVLRLDAETDSYTQQVYTQTEDKKDYVPGEIIIPQRRGVPLNFIPFALPWAINAPPLLDLVDVNLSHYRASADLKHGLHFAALPTPWVSGQADTSKPLTIGGGVAWSLAQGGTAGMLEVSGPGFQAIRTDMTEMQKMMATLGARLIEEGGVVRNESSTTIGMRLASDHASLRTTAQIVEQQLTWALQVHSWWVGNDVLVADVDAVVELNKDFLSTTATPEEVKTLLLLLQSDSISFETFYERLRAGKWAREGVTMEEEQAAIAKAQAARQPAMGTPGENPFAEEGEETPEGEEGEEGAEQEEPVEEEIGAEAVSEEDRLKLALKRRKAKPPPNRFGTPKPKPSPKPKPNIGKPFGQ